MCVCVCVGVCARVCVGVSGTMEGEIQRHGGQQLMNGIHVNPSGVILNEYQL